MEQAATGGGAAVAGVGATVAAGGAVVAVKEVRILETAEDIQDRRDQVLSRYQQFRSEARIKREKLEDSRKFQVRCCLI